MSKNENGTKKVTKSFIKSKADIFVHLLIRNIATLYVRFSKKYEIWLFFASKNYSGV
jgi:hypothetical protein